MGRKTFSVCAAVLFLLPVGVISAHAGVPTTTISFSDALSGVDGNTAGWSTGDGTVELKRKSGAGATSWSLLGGDASVRSIGGTLSHRLTRGLGIWAGELDEIDAVERLVVAFTNPFLLTSIEVRSLFSGETGGDERGRVKLFSNGEQIAMQQFRGIQPDGDGVRTVSFNLDSPIDKMVFSVPASARGYSEFALAKVTGTVVPEPISATLFLIGGAALVVRARRKKK